MKHATISSLITSLKLGPCSSTMKLNVDKDTFCGQVEKQNKSKFIIRIIFEQFSIFLCCFSKTFLSTYFFYADRWLSPTYTTLKP